MINSLSVREAAFEDYPQIVTLESRYGLEVKSFEQWKHLWSNNPAYKGHESELPIGWVLEGGNKQITGYLGNIPLFYEILGRRLLACVAHSWVVDEQYRSYALLLLDEYFSQQKVDLFLNSTVGPNAADSFAVFQSLPVPVGEWNRSLFWITNHHGFLRGWLATKGIRLAKPLTYALSAGPFLKHAFSRSAIHRHPKINVQPCDEIDERFDVFWDTLRRRDCRVLRAVRNREFLNWHFQYALQNRQAWILAAGEGSEISSYGIFLRQDNAKYGLKRVRFIDFQCLENSTDALLPTLSWALRRCRREGIHMLECIGFRPDKRNVIATARPYNRKLPSWLYFYKTSDKELAQTLSDPLAWDPSQFDGDASL